MDKDIYVCPECGEVLNDPNTYHTYESCLLYRLNDCRKYLGKAPIEIDIEAEDKVLKMKRGE